MVKNMSKTILRVNMSTLEAKYEDLPEKYAGLGGRTCCQGEW